MANFLGVVVREVCAALAAALLMFACVLALYVSEARSETIPATSTWRYVRTCSGPSGPCQSAEQTGTPSAATALALCMNMDEPICNWNPRSNYCAVTGGSVTGQSAAGTPPGTGGWFMTFSIQYTAAGAGGSCVGPLTWNDSVATSDPVLTCPAGQGYTLAGSNCTRPDCPAGQHYVGASCVTTCPAAGAAGPSLGIPAAASPGANLCYNTCQYQFASASNQYQTGGSQIWYGTTVASGMNCTGGETSATNPATLPQSCPAGQVPGTINGAFACLPSSDASPAKTVSQSTTTTTNAAGGVTGTSTTTTTTTTGGAGTTTTTTTTDKDAGGAVTGGSTVVKNASGGDKPADPSDFCKQNPTLSVCKTSAWGGSCGSFTCDGDAVQCAVAQEIYKRNCQLFETSSPESDLYGDVKAGNDPLKSSFPNDPSKLSTFSFSGAIDQSAWLGGGGSLADVTFTVSGHSVSIPFSRWNEPLQIAGLILVALSLIVAARIVVEGA